MNRLAVVERAAGGRFEAQASSLSLKVIASDLNGFSCDSKRTIPGLSIVDVLWNRFATFANIEAIAENIGLIYVIDPIGR